MSPKRDKTTPAWFSDFWIQVKWRKKNPKMEDQGENRTKETACQEAPAGKQKETEKPWDAEK